MQTEKWVNEEDVDIKEITAFYLRCALTLQTAKNES